MLKQDSQNHSSASWDTMIPPPPHQHLKSKLAITENLYGNCVLMLYIPVNYSSVMLRHFPDFLGWTNSK